MEWKEYTKLESEVLYGEIDFNSFSIRDVKYNELREKLTRAYYNVCDEIEERIEEGTLQNTKKKYYIDCFFGIELYRILHRMGFHDHDASNDGIWRFMSIEVIPDIVFERWANNPERFYKTPNRIWLKSIWWYVYQSLQKKEVDGKIKYDIFKTKEILEKFDTDYILNIVDRSGRDGFFLDLNRVIIRKLYDNRFKTEKYPRFHRKIMVLNTAMLKVYDPSLFKGGIEGYVDSLFDFVLKGLE